MIYFLDAKVRRSMTTTIPIIKSDFREFVEDFLSQVVSCAIAWTAKSSFFLTSDQHEAENFGGEFFGP